MSLTKGNAKREKMRHFLEEVVPEASRATEFVQRQSKLSGTVLVEMWQWVCLENPRATLNEMVQYCAESGLHQRLNERAVGLLSHLVSRVLQQFVPEAVTSTVLDQFRAINILDSSLLTLPTSLAPWFKGNGRPGQQATAKMQVSVDYRSGQVKGLEVVDGRVPDQHCSGLTAWAEPQSLNLFDLGFFDQDRLADLHGQQAFFVTRLHSQVALYQTAEATQAVDLLAWLQAQPENQGEGVFYLGSAARLPVRVVFAAVPSNILETRRRQAKAKAKQREIPARSTTWLYWLGPYSSPMLPRSGYLPPRFWLFIPCAGKLNSFSSCGSPRSTWPPGAGAPCIMSCVISMLICSRFCGSIG